MRSPPADAYRLYARALAVSEKNAGPDNYLVAGILYQMAKIDAARGDRASALGALQRARDLIERKGTNKTLSPNIDDLLADLQAQSGVE